MKRNQFWLTAMRLLVNTVFFYVLGVMTSNYVKNNTLLIDVDETIVSQSTDKVEPLNITVDKFTAIDLPDMYTYIQEQATVAYTMNAIWIFIKSNDVKSFIDKSINSYALVPNYQLDKPPRNDMICVNTS